jgi:hypothetical protein
MLNKNYEARPWRCRLGHYPLRPYTLSDNSYTNTSPEIETIGKAHAWPALTIISMHLLHFLRWINEKYMYDA